MAKTMTGIVASNKGNKTIVVSVITHKTHPIYKKKYLVTKRIMAHDEANEAQVGDKVIIAETRPISANKHFSLEKIVETAAIEHVESEQPEVIKASEPVVAKKIVTKPAAKKAKNADAEGDK